MLLYFVLALDIIPNVALGIATLDVPPDITSNVSLNISLESIEVPWHDDENDSDYIPTNDYVNADDDSCNEETCDDIDDNYFLVHGGQLLKLFNYCLNCGCLIDRSAMKRTDLYSGSQLGKIFSMV